MIYTDDPIDDFNRHDAEQQKELDKRPVCGHCKNPIQDDHCYLTDSGKTCPDCLETYYREEIDIE